jgi:predicted TIM-barrel fold metal-dependent hydrolase
MQALDIHRHIALGAEEHSLFRVPQRADFARWVTASRDLATGGECRLALQPPPYFVLTNGLEDVRRLNDLTYALKQALGARAPVAFGTVEPHHGDAGLPEIDRIARELKFTGVAWRHRANGAFVDAPAMQAFVKRAHEHGLVPVLHGAPRSGNEAIWRVWRLAEQFPSITMVVLGALASWDQQSAILAEPKRAPNVVYDITGMWGEPETLVAVAERLGAERLLFGSGAHCDEPLDSERLARRIEKSEIPDALKRAVLWGNAARVLKLEARS